MGKCCVPGCNSSKIAKRVSSHCLPKNRLYAAAWLNMIGRRDLIGKPREILDKLSVCGMHFTKDMIIPYGKQRWLSANALPVVHLPKDSIDAPQDNDNSTSNTANTDNTENVECKQQGATAKENNSQ